MTAFGFTDEDPRLLSAHRGCLEAGIPFVVVSLFPWGARLGPALLGGACGCLACFDNQRRRFFSPHSFRASKDGLRALEDAGLLQRLVHELGELLRGGESPLREGWVFHLSSAGEMLLRYRCVKDPLCPACSSWSRHPSEPSHSHGRIPAA